jgi:hypothetical protein
MNACQESVDTPLEHIAILVQANEYKATTPSPEHIDSLDRRPVS